MLEIRYDVLIPARNEEKRLPLTLKALLNQSFKPSNIIVVNDGSIDRTRKIALKYGCIVVDLPFHKESWAGMPKLSKVFNVGIDKIGDVDFFGIVGADTILELRYFEKVIKRMVKDRWVIGSGRIIGEYSRLPRGSGRVFFKEFWDRYIHRFPYCYSWESYPLYKALSLGFRIGVVRDAVMIASRSTKLYKDFYGYTMRELGYFPPYALARILYAFINDHRTGVNMLRTYLKPVRVMDVELCNWIKVYQIKSLFKNFWTLGRGL